MKTLKSSIRFMVLMTVLTGFFYPGLMTLFAQVAFPQKAHGSLIQNSQGQVIGSELIGQNFKSEKYFWSRPSAIDCNPMPSGGTNLGPTSQDLLAKINARREAGGVEDLLFASGSGLDPHVSPTSALNQIPRVAKARGLDETEVRSLVEKHMEGRQLGFLGEERVNVFSSTWIWMPGDAKMEKERPDPQELLQAVEKLEADSRRGKLRVFLGMCPGVGKTYAMLKAAKEQKNRGRRVLVAVVETHGRKETQDLLSDLPFLSRKRIEYRGTELFEMDLDGVLKESPDLVIADEVAHTNAPGSRHAKRFQDIEEILAAGIDVYTTVNIQHIETRKDSVAQITGVQVKEAVPDSFFEKADQIEVIDLPPSELLHRLQEGKVYLGERANWAAENFFKEERLTALRELALRFTAEKVDQDLQDQMLLKGIEGPWNANERLLVAISHSPYSARLIRTTRRMAYNLEAPWVALYVNTGENLRPEDQEALQKNLALAKELGAEMITIADTNLIHAIQKVCKDRNVTQIVMGRPDRRFFRDLIARGTILDQLVRTTSEFDVHVIRAERRPQYKGFYLRWPRFKTGLFPYYYTTWFLAAVSVLCYGLLPWVGYRTLGAIFLLCILIVSSITSRGPILFAAVISALVWNFFFIPPRFTFVVGLLEDRMMLLAFFVTAIVGGFLTSRVRRQEEVLRSRESQTRSLYDLAKGLSEAQELNQVVAVLTATVEKQFAGEALVILEDQDGNLEKIHDQTLDPKDYAVARWVFEHGKSAGWSTQTLLASPCLCLPMKGKTGIVGVFIYYPDAKQKNLTMEQENFMDGVLTQGAIAVERYRFSEAAQATKVYEASERLHQTLLNSVSHELRTPITALIGISTALKEPNTIGDEKAREALTDELVREAQRLNRSVENLLDISRLETTHQRWAGHISGRLEKWGFNIMGTRRDQPPMLFPDWPYYTWCAASHSFARKTQLLTAPGVPGYMTFVDIFDPAWERHYDQVCRETARPCRDDKWLVGYYTDNELFWGVTFYPGQSLLDACLFQGAETFNKRELVRFLQDRYRGDLAAFNSAWQLQLPAWESLLAVTELPAFNDTILADKRAWLFHYARRYFGVVSKTLRKHDPNHLILGCRIHGWSEPELARAMGEFIDVISYNKYDGLAPAWQMAELFYRHSGLPILLSEWGFRAMDAGLTNTGGVGRIVADQKTRGQKYAQFIEGLAESPYCIGSIFYAYVDDPASGGGGMMHNENSNYGMVNIKDEPYADFVRAMSASHRRLIDHRLKAPPSADYLHITCPRDFHREPVNRFFIQRNGHVVDNHYLRAFLRGTDAGLDYQETQFDIDFDRPIKLAALVYESELSPEIEFILDGRSVATFKLPAAEGLGHISYPMPTCWHTVYNREIAINIPKGPHTLTIRNIGTGWTWLDGYRIYPRKK